jgi:hypothetical protein
VRASHNLNSREGDHQTFRQQAPQRGMGTLFERWRGHVDFQRAFPFARDLIVAGAWLQVKMHGVRALPDIHGPAAPQTCERSPKSAVPRRTMVAPSSMAVSKSWDMPMESTGKDIR